MSGRRAAARQSRLSTAPTIGEVKHTLCRLIEENAGIPSTLVRDESTISGDLAMDSFSFVALQVAVEETFSVTCTPADIEGQNRFDAIARLVRERICVRGKTSTRRGDGNRRRGARNGARRRSTRNR